MKYKYSRKQIADMWSSLGAYEDGWRTDLLTTKETPIGIETTPLEIKSGFADGGKVIGVKPITSQLHGSTTLKTERIVKIGEGWDLPDDDRGAILSIAEKLNEVIDTVNDLIEHDH